VTSELGITPTRIRALLGRLAEASSIACMAIVALSRSSGALLVVTAATFASGCSTHSTEPASPARVARSAVAPDADILRDWSEGAAHNRAGLFVEAEARLGRALSQLRAQAAPDRDLFMNVLSEVARLYSRTARSRASREAAGEALALLEPGMAGDDEQIRQLEGVIAKSYLAEGQPLLAVVHYRRALVAAARHPQNLRAGAVETSVALSVALASAEDNPAAVSTAETALDMALRGGSRSRTVHDATLNLAATYLKAGRPQAARRLLDEQRGVLRIWHPHQSEPQGAPLEEAVLRPVARGRVQYGKMGTLLSESCTYCAHKTRVPGLASDGTARLTVGVARDGSVSHVLLTALGLSLQAADCMVLQAAALKFPRPASDGAVIVFATETFP
jgi:hypothetical protein